MQFRFRILAVLLSVFVCISLFSCKTAPVIPQSSPTPTATATATPTPTATPEPTAIPTPVHQIFPITFGLSNGSSYQNEFFNIAVDVDDDWFVYTTDQYDLANEFSNTVTDDMRHQKYLMYLSTGTTIMDYDAVLHTGLKEIVIKINDIAPIKADYPDPVSFQVELSKGVVEAFEADGTAVYDDEIKDVTIAGHQASCWYLSYATKGYMVYTADISYWQGDYNIGIILTSTGTNQLDEMIAMFRAVN